MGEVVRDRAHEESERDEPAEDPRDGGLEPRIDRRELPDRDHGDQGEDDDPAELHPDLDAEDAGDRDAHQVLAFEVARTGAAAATPAHRRACDAVRIATPSATTPIATVVSDQNCSGKSWTRWSVRGSNV